MFTKIGETIEIERIEDSDSCIPVISSEILDQFKKFAADLKKIAPKANDFLYFSAVMMHAAEASSINDDGTQKLTRSGEPVKVGWDTSNGTIKWVSNDPSIKPFKNANGDIFPSQELVKAYKKWVGKPLCIDHKSSSVDHVRGIIVDTYYDRKLMRVIALCALDKLNYPELAKKVSTGVSNCVSMGTAVGRAICTDCSTVARTEADFCRCMKTKTGYGEINIDLNPIELSIVVNGADPKAKIKHIIAAANSLSTYIEQKEAEFKKFHASLTTNDGKAINVSASNLETFRVDLDKAVQDLSEIQENFSSTATTDLVFNQPASEEEIQKETTEFNLAPPADRFAEEDLKNQLLQITSSIESKLNQMRNDFSKLAQQFSHNTITTTKEEIMSGSKDNLNKKSYFQGAGGPNEPQTYPKDPANEQLRDSGDKHMVGQMDTGPVDGMHPGPDSVSTSELERKKMLARAEAEERALRRSAVLAQAKQTLENRKEAYFQGGGDVNDPAKLPYPKDPMQDKLRDGADKHMVGQKPFPDVGAVDGLHPSPASADQKDEKKRKEMLARAGLKARFVKAAKEDGSYDYDNSAWEVLSETGEVVLKASVAEIAGDRSEALFSAVATQEYGKDLIRKVRAHGAEKAKSFFKKAQEAAPAPAPVNSPVDAVPPAAEDTGKEGDPKETAVELAEKVRDLGSDLVEAVSSLTGDKAEMGEFDALKADDNAVNEEGRVSLAHINTMRKEIQPALVAAMQEQIDLLNYHGKELNTIASMYAKGAVNETNKELASSIVEDAFVDAKQAIADGTTLIHCFMRYSDGTEAFKKRAQEEVELSKSAYCGEKMHSDDSLMAMIEDTNKDLEDVGSELGMMDEFEADDEDETDENMLAMLADDVDVIDENDAVMVPDAATAAQVSKDNPNADVEVKKASFDLNSKEGRLALRAKLASEMKTSPIFYDFHPKGKVQTPGLEVKPEGDLAVVENIEEVHDKVMDLATAPPKVRKEAEQIQKLVSEGSLDPKDLDALVANGLDKDVVAYWKKYFGEVDGGSEFASELIKEHKKAQVEEEINTHKVKLARAYELAYEMVDRGLVVNERKAIKDQVEDIMKWNDASFDNVKKIIAQHQPGVRKVAGQVPQVGLNLDSQFSSPESTDLYSEFSQMLSNSKKRNFF